LVIYDNDDPMPPSDPFLPSQFAYIAVKDRSRIGVPRP